MSKKQIYLAGAMTAFDDNKALALEWRDDLSNALKEDFKVINPALEFWFDPEPDDRAAFEWDLYQVRHSDIVIVNFSHNAKSLGTQHELSLAFEMRIPIVGLNETNEILHPWQQIVCQKIFSDREELLHYIKTYYY